MQVNKFDMEQDKETQYKPVSNIWLGIVLVAAGVIFGAHRLVAGVPDWIVSWPMAVIVCGILIGIYHRFKTFFWIIPVFWGIYLMLELHVPSLQLGKYVGAISIIAVGVVFLFLRPGPNNMRRRMFEHVRESFIDITCILNNVRKEVTKQDFKAADVTCILGNAIIDLRNCDIQGSAVTDITVFMGNAKILVPETWTIQNQASSVFGDVQHKRLNAQAVLSADKILRFDGTAIFGTIHIVSC